MRALGASMGRRGFGYVTATLATFFVWRDAESEEAEAMGAYKHFPRYTPRGMTRRASDITGAASSRMKAAPFYGGAYSGVRFRRYRLLPARNSPCTTGMILTRLPDALAFAAASVV